MKNKAIKLENTCGVEVGDQFITSDELDILDWGEQIEIGTSDSVFSMALFKEDLPTIIAALQQYV